MAEVPWAKGEQGEIAERQPVAAEYRIEYSIQRQLDHEADFIEIGFGSSGRWDSLDFCAHMVVSAVTHNEWETTPGMPDPSTVLAAIKAGGSDG